MLNSVYYSVKNIIIKKKIHIHFFILQPWYFFRKPHWLLDLTQQSSQRSWLLNKNRNFWPSLSRCYRLSYMLICNFKSLLFMHCRSSHTHITSPKVVLKKHGILWLASLSQGIGHPCPLQACMTIPHFAIFFIVCLLLIFFHSQFSGMDLVHIASKHHSHSSLAHTQCAKGKHELVHFKVLTL